MNVSVSHVLAMANVWMVLAITLAPVNLVTLDPTAKRVYLWYHYVVCKQVDINVNTNFKDALYYYLAKW